MDGGNGILGGAGLGVDATQAAKAAEFSEGSTCYVVYSVCIVAFLSPRQPVYMQKWDSSSYQASNQDDY